MKRLLAVLTIAAASASAPALAADIGVSINIGQPNFYGRLDIGGFPPPPVLYPQPVMIQAVPVGRPPLYLRVPPGHAKHWEHHCHEYNACGERVYFVQDNWYQREYAPRYRERHGEYRDERRGDYRDHYREERHEDRGGDHDHGHGHGHGHGHDD